MTYRRCVRWCCLNLTLTLVAGVLAGCGGGSAAPSPPPVLPPPVTSEVDLLTLAGGNGLARVFGAASTGRFGVPVAGGLDCDDDGFLDYAMSNMQASPLGRDRAGQVLLIFGDGQLAHNLDTSLNHPNVLIVAGAAVREATGGEIWMDDVTGDGVGDLIVGRPNFRAPAANRIGAGALSIVVGSPVLRDLAGNNQILDLAAPPSGTKVLTLVGAAALDRLGFWMRTGDVTGDGIADLLVGADQEDAGGESNRGAAYLIRGGAHLNATLTVDLAQFGQTALAGHLVRLTPPPQSADYHFGATVAVADLDGNGLSDVLIAASLSRVGGLLVADGAPADSAVRNGGNLGGSLFILWDDNFTAGASWPAGFTFAMDAPPASFSRIDGGTLLGVFASERFAEEMLGGLDYDGDGRADLFAGDIKGDARGRVDAGVGHVFFGAADLKGLEFSMAQVPANIRVTTLLGATAGDISSDTAWHGDLDGDGLTDLVIASPLASPRGRIQAGIAHVLWGQSAPWPATIDLAANARPALATFAITDILGAHGALSADDTGDTLMYSATAGDMDGDGRSDLIINEMRGNGVAATALDVGNMLVLSGALIAKP